jgi:hypothetical protein
MRLNCIWRCIDGWQTEALYWLLLLIADAPLALSEGYRQSCHHIRFLLHAYLAFSQGSGKISWSRQGHVLHPEDLKRHITWRVMPRCQGNLLSTLLAVVRLAGEKGHWGMDSWETKPSRIWRFSYLHGRAKYPSRPRSSLLVWQVFFGY